MSSFKLIRLNTSCQPLCGTTTTEQVSIRDDADGSATEVLVMLNMWESVWIDHISTWYVSYMTSIRSLPVAGTSISVPQCLHLYETANFIAAANEPCERLVSRHIHCLAGTPVCFSLAPHTSGFRTTLRYDITLFCGACLHAFVDTVTFFGFAKPCSRS